MKKEPESYFAENSILGLLPSSFIKDGVLNISNLGLFGTIETNCEYVICNDNKLNDIIADDAIFVNCSNNKIDKLDLPKVRILVCTGNNILKYNCPELKEITK